MEGNKVGEQILGWIVLGLLGFGLYAGISWVIDKSKGQSAVKATEPDPRDQKIEELSAQVKALQAKPVEHHYELRNEGTRSFRFDPTTGESCIQLASKADWKLPDTIRQGCQYQDWINAPNATNQDYLAAECVLVHDAKSCKQVGAAK